MAKKGYRQHEGDKWRVDITLGGHRHTYVYTTEAEAIKCVANIKDRHERGLKTVTAFKGKGITLKEAFDACYKDREVGWTDTDHGKKQKYYAQSFFNFFGANTPLEDITKENWYKYTDTFKNTATNNRRASCMNKIFNHAIENGTLEANKKLKIKRQKEKLTRLYAFTRADEKAIYDACDKLGYDDLKDFITVLIDTGARAEELLKASVKDFQYYSDGTFTLNLYRTKTDVDSNIGLKKRSQEILKRRSNSVRFFMGSYKHFYRRFQHLKKTMGKTSDKNFVFHTCRHTCASRMAEAGVPLAEVAAWLGHSPSSPVTARYIHFYGGKKIDVAAKLDAYDEQLDTKVVRLAVGGEKI